MDEKTSYLVLASGSPQRLDLLRSVGFEPVVRVPNIDESIIDEETAESLVERLAITKLNAVIKKGECGVAADTVVLINGNILGKPGSPEKAVNMLNSLSGKSHKVITGIALSGPKGKRSSTVVTKVRWRKLSEKEILTYVQTGEPLNKAGGYGIQGGGADFVTSYDGSYENIIGLPTCKVMTLLRELGCDCIT